ncbi:hypothetical protein K474DRAFT_458794 [Panus rudis PR-1116 ss-1]|nr:hypothetical protein K474DRAFT_458794 [Panus rudis PR-1116 ss-1]
MRTVEKTEKQNRTLAEAPESWRYLLYPNFSQQLVTLSLSFQRHPTPPTPFHTPTAQSPTPSPALSASPPGSPGTPDQSPVAARRRPHRHMHLAEGADSQTGNLVPRLFSSTVFTRSFLGITPE